VQYNFNRRRIANARIGVAREHSAALRSNADGWRNRPIIKSTSDARTLCDLLGDREHGLWRSSLRISLAFRIVARSWRGRSKPFPQDRCFRETSLPSSMRRASFSTVFVSIGIRHSMSPGFIPFDGVIVALHEPSAKHRAGRSPTEL
jgi:hypothetical protein